MTAAVFHTTHLGLAVIVCALLLFAGIPTAANLVRLHLARQAARRALHIRYRQMLSLRRSNLGASGDCYQQPAWQAADTERLVCADVMAIARAAYDARIARAA